MNDYLNYHQVGISNLEVFTEFILHFNVSFANLVPVISTFLYSAIATKLRRVTKR